jgi:hypothetical protein
MEVTALVYNPCNLLKNSDTLSTEVELGSIRISAMFLGIWPNIIIKGANPVLACTLLLSACSRAGNR